jgi:hypothetical protein
MLVTKTNLLPLVLLLMSFGFPAMPAQAQGAMVDMRKGIIELPTARLLRSTDPVSMGNSPVRPITQSAQLAALETTDANGVVGHVRPGLVHWRASFAQAVAAAKHSGKPVLLLQLMGRLDDEFC